MRISLPDNIESHWLWNDSERFQWWIKLLRLTAEEDGEVLLWGKVHKMKRGEIICTQGMIAKELGTTTAKAQSFLRALEAHGDIRRKTDAKLTQLVICDIDSYDDQRRNLDAILTQSGVVRRNLDAILTQLKDCISELNDDQRRNLDAILTQLRKEKENEKRKVSPIPPIKKKEKEKRKEDANAKLSPACADDAMGRAVEVANVEEVEFVEVKVSSADRQNKTTKSGKPKTIVHRAREIFEGLYKEQFGSTYYWSAKDATNMGQLLKKIEFSRKSRDVPLPTDDDSILEAFTLFLGSINKNYIINNFSVCKINSQYNEIISEIRNNRTYVRTRQTGIDPASTNRDFIASQQRDVLDSVAKADAEWLAARQQASLNS